MYDLTLYEGLAVLKHKHKLSFTHYKLLAEWLGVYTYISPSERYLNESALLISPIDSLRTSYISVWELMTILETNYTTSEQSNIIRYIQCYLKK
jgi:hypothetical protein